MKLLVLAIIATIFQSCASMPSSNIKPLPANERVASFEVPTSLDKKKAFQAINMWAAKSFGDSKEVVRMNDPESGTFIAKSHVDCDALKLGSGWAKDQRVEFILQITVEPKVVKIKFENVIGVAGSWDSALRPSTKAEMDAVSDQCLKPHVVGIGDAVR